MRREAVDGPGQASRPTIEVLRAEEIRDNPGLSAEWAAIVAASDHVNVLYASAGWFHSLGQAYGEDQLALVMFRGATGEALGVVPARRAGFSLAFDISNYSLFTWRTAAVHVLGSIPLLPLDDKLLREICERLLRIWPDCTAVYFDTVPLDDQWNAAIERAGQNMLLYAPDGARPWFLLDLPSSSAEYLASLGGKTRSTLRRKARKLEEKFGPVSVLRVDSPACVNEFLADATRVSKNSWQQRLLGTRISQAPESLRWFTDLAERGILRAYLIRCGSTPCAFVVGYQFQGVFHYAELGYDSQFAEYSPGTVLLFHLIQDLCDSSRCHLLNFGMGDAEYKRRFGTTQRRDISYLLLAPTLRHRVIINSHRLFRAGVRLVRRFVKRDTGQIATPDLTEQPP